MLYAIIMGIIALFIAIFALQNAAAVEVSFLVWHFSLSLALIILGCLLLGFLLASLWTLKVKAGHYMKDRKLKEQLRQLEEKKENWEARQREQVSPAGSPGWTCPGPGRKKGGLSILPGTRTPSSNLFGPRSKKQP